MPAKFSQLDAASIFCLFPINDLLWHQSLKMLPWLKVRPGNGIFAIIGVPISRDHTSKLCVNIIASKSIWKDPELVPSTNRHIEIRRVNSEITFPAPLAIVSFSDESACCVKGRTLYSNGRTFKVFMPFIQTKMELWILIHSVSGMQVLILRQRFISRMTLLALSVEAQVGF